MVQHVKGIDPGGACIAAHPQLRDLADSDVVRAFLLQFRV